MSRDKPLKVKLVKDEQHLPFERLAERWNERSAQMGRDDRWAVIDDEFVKVHWPSKKPEDPSYHYVLIDGVLCYNED